ncbi:hypothetical protein HYU06_05445 [Candidatus Woesearchaeota archaeon]|nr:hypothetical protein [Candidatus Woesearchaeota archaeon]
MVIFEKTWDIMDITEKDIYVKWHDYAYQDDLESAEYLVEKHPRNAIVLGYYSMHNISKKYLGDVFSIKIPQDDTHSLTLKALKEKISKEATRKRVIELMKKAQEEYEVFSKPKPELLSALLRHGRSERASHSYYQSKQDAEKRTGSDKAKEFINTIVKPFIKIMNELDI